MWEIYDIIDSKSRMELRRRKETVSDLFVLAEVTANRIIHGFNSNRSESDLVRPWHVYPDLFEDMSEDIEEQREMIELENYKARFNRGVAAWNKRFEKEQINDS